MERAAIFVFDWDWEYLGHKFLPVPPAELEKAGPVARDLFARNEARPLIPPHVKDVHMMIVITDAKDDEVDAQAIAMVRANRKEVQSHVETWEHPEGLALSVVRKDEAES